MKKIQLNDTYGYENFISDEEKNILLDWINENHNKFNVNGISKSDTLAAYGSRKFCTSDSIDNFPTEIVKKIKDRVIEIENIKEWIEEPTFKDLIGINGEGGSIHLHTDPNVDGYVHVRYNVILKYPKEGGHSIYNGKINELKENMVWRCVAGKVMHGSEPVKGDIPRITLSLGFQIKDVEKKVHSLI
jgi:hypothetical protein